MEDSGEADEGIDGGARGDIDVGTGSDVETQYESIDINRSSSCALLAQSDNLRAFWGRGDTTLIVEQN